MESNKTTDNRWIEVAQELGVTDTQMDKLKELTPKDENWITYLRKMMFNLRAQSPFDKPSPEALDRCFKKEVTSLTKWTNWVKWAHGK